MAAPTKATTKTVRDDSYPGRREIVKPHAGLFRGTR